MLGDTFEEGVARDPVSHVLGGLLGQFSGINFLPENSTTVTGGSTQQFFIGRDSPIVGGGLPIIGLSPTGAQANILGFQAQKIQSESANTPTNHIIVTVDFKDTISNVTAVGTGRGQLNPP